MNLLPKEHGQFAQEAYWDDFFKSRGNNSFDWYGEYPELSGVLHKYIKPNSSVLMVGCGNSRLSEDLYDLSYRNIHNIDISENVIQHMIERNAKKRPSMVFTKMDATQMTFEADAFRAAIDKGTFDALLPNKDNVDTALRMLDEVWRVLQCMGVYVIVTLAQDHVLRTLVDAFSSRSCIFRAHKLPSRSDEGTFLMPVFAVVITKLKQIANTSAIWELFLHEGTTTRCSNSDELMQSMKECQYYAMLQQKLSSGSQMVEGVQPMVRLYSANNSSAPRYTIYIVDKQVKSKNKLAVFITPQGLEHDWIYSTEEGRKELSSSIDYQRILVVTLSRGHHYKDVDEVKTELSSKVMELAPPKTLEKDVPFMTLNSGIGIRNVIYEAHSKRWGCLYVEDVNVVTNKMVRQTFSEMLIEQGKPEPISSAQVVTRKRKNGAEVSINHSQLEISAENAIASCVCLCNGTAESLPSVLLVGLRCGTLASYLYKHMYGIAIKDVVCVEEEDEIVKIANKFYDFPDGMTLIQNDYKGAADRLATEGKKFDGVIIRDLCDDDMNHFLPLLADGGLWISTSDFGAARLIHKQMYDGVTFKVYIRSSKEINRTDKRIKIKLHKIDDKLNLEKASKPVDNLSAYLDKFCSVTD